MLWIPLRRPTPSEYAVLVVSFSVLCIVLGVVAVVMGFHQPAEKHELAVALEYRGAWCFSIGGAVAFGYWLYRRLKD